MAYHNNTYLNSSYFTYFSATIPSEPWYDPTDSVLNNSRAQRAYRSVFTFTPWSEALHHEQNNSIEDSRGEIYVEGVYDSLMLYAYAINESLIVENNLPKDQFLRANHVLTNMWGRTFKGTFYIYIFSNKH